MLHDIHILPNNLTQISYETVPNKHIISWIPKGLLIMKVNYFIINETISHPCSLRMFLILELFTSFSLIVSKRLIPTKNKSNSIRYSTKSVKIS